MFQGMRSWIDQLGKAGLLARMTKPFNRHTQRGALCRSKLGRGGLVLSGAVS
jgi:hypothetical protein